MEFDHAFPRQSLAMGVSIRSSVECLSVALLPNRLGPPDHAIHDGLVHSVGHRVDPLKKHVQVDQIGMHESQREVQILRPACGQLGRDEVMRFQERRVRGFSIGQVWPAG